ncbi:hypothetical protein V5O48_004452, partial [Marasmius crinis-equi]
MDSSLTFRKHIFCHAVTAWGHNKPLITLAILIAELRKDVAITILTDAVIYPRMVGELAKLSPERLKPIERQINVLQVVPLRSNPLQPALEVVPEFEKLFKQAGTITCLATGKTVDAAYFPSPSLAIVDPFAECVLEGIRSMATPEQVPVISWVTGSAGPLLLLWGPERYGGRGDFVARIEAEVKKGKTETEAFEIVCGASEQVTQIPGYPAFYDYERFPQEVPPLNEGAHQTFMQIGYKSIAKSEGVISIASSVLEEEAIKACREFYSSLGKTFFPIGPMSVIPTPSKSGNDAVTNQVVSFLDDMKNQFGDKSVLYVSFGTFWWPAEPTVFYAILDHLIASKKPFILAHPSPIVQPDEQVLEKIRACPTAMD